MTQWDDNQPKNDSPLMGILPALDTLENGTDSLKSPSAACSTTVSSTSVSTSTVTASSEICLTSTCTSDEVSSSQLPCSSDEVGAIATVVEETCGSSMEEILLAEIPSSSSDSGWFDGDVNKSNTVIALPPPPLPFSIGNTCGGNQSYLGYKNTRLTSLQERATSPVEFLDGKFGPSMENSTSSLSMTAREAGVVGLNNLGNTCFMNSGLQCLINTPPVVEFFLKSERITRPSTATTSIVLEFQNLIRKAWLKSDITLNLQEFKNVLGNSHSQFKDTRQHDCQEFLSLTLDALHEQLMLSNGSKAENQTTLVSSEISRKTSTDTSSDVSSAAGSDSEVSSSQKSPEESRHSRPMSEGSPETKRRRVSSTVDENIEILSNDPDVEMDDETGQPDTSFVTKEDESSADSGIGPTNTVIANGDISDSEIDVDGETMDGENDGNKSNEDLLKAQAEEGKENWRQYINKNDTIIASSFQGQYKSTVTCSVCNYVSRLYEPFIFLSLPIPRTMDRQFSVTFSSFKDISVKKIDITVNGNENVGKLKEEVVQKALEGLELGTPMNVFVVAEVVNRYVFRILDDETPLKTVYDGNRNIYVYEVNEDFDDLGTTMTYGPALEECNLSQAIAQPESLRPSTYLDEDWETDTPSLTCMGDPGATFGGPNFETQSKSSTDPNSVTIEWAACAVCLEDFPKQDLRQHYGCVCILCVDCMKKTATHFECVEGEVPSEDKLSTHLKCPVCAEIVEYEKCFVSLIESSESCVKKLHLIPLLFRVEADKDTNNNSPIVSKLIGYPWVVKLPSVLPATEFHDFIKKINPFPNHDYKIIYSSWDGKSCSQCIYSVGCRGCEIPSDISVSINPKNSVMISYINLSPDLIASFEQPDMAIQANLGMPAWGWTRREEPMIDIHECLKAFSEIEHLDEQNPWNCPQCKAKRCATKKLTVTRFPDYLIVYLKRFVFVDHASNKLNNRLTFPITDLDVSQYIAEECAGSQHVYDLYSCVCHYGTASAGHYTAFGKNPVTGSWHYFNDESVSSKSPSEPEFSSAYVLFYARKGLKSDIPARRNMILPRFRYSSMSGNRNRDASASDKVLSDVDSTSSVGPTIGSYGMVIDQDNLANVTGTLLYPEDAQDNSISPSEPTFYHKSSELSTKNSPGRETRLSVSPENLNGVRQEVSNLRISPSSTDDDLRRKVPVRSSTAAYVDDKEEKEDSKTLCNDDTPDLFKKPLAASQTYQEFLADTSKKGKNVIPQVTPPSESDTLPD